MSAYRVAPPGFSPDQWREFRERGIVILEDALTPEEIAHYRGAVDRVCARDPGYVEGATDYRVSNAVESDPAIAELIDHPRHVGYAYDLYGEMLKIMPAPTSSCGHATPTATCGTRTARAPPPTGCSRPSCRCA